MKFLENTHFIRAVILLAVGIFFHFNSFPAKHFIETRQQINESKKHMPYPHGKPDDPYERHDTSVTLSEISFIASAVFFILGFRAMRRKNKETPPAKEEISLP
ncbi:hypothetical protein N9082_01065 [Akkermansiaceae bacterium]|nr:hypothetical protein [Akkermansiaceae bacterium]